MGRGAPLYMGWIHAVNAARPAPALNSLTNGCPTRNQQYQPGLVTVLTLDFVVGS